VPVHACHEVTFTFTLYKNIDFVLQREHIEAPVEILTSRHFCRETMWFFFLYDGLTEYINKACEQNAE